MGQTIKSWVFFFSACSFAPWPRKFAALPDEVKTSNEGQTDLFSSIDVQPGNLPDTSVDSYVQERVEYTLVTTVARHRELLPVYEAYNVLCYDTETTGTDPMHAELLGIALSGEPGKAVYVALNAETMDAEAAKALLRPLLTPYRCYLRRS